MTLEFIPVLTQFVFERRKVNSHGFDYLKFISGFSIANEIEVINENNWKTKEKKTEEETRCIMHTLRDTHHTLNVVQHNLACSP